MYGLHKIPLNEVRGAVVLDKRSVGSIFIYFCMCLLESLG